MTATDGITAERPPQEHPVNWVETGFDATECFVFLEKVASGWKESDRLDVVMLRALCNLSAAQPDKAKVGFASWDVVDAVGTVRGRPWSSPDDKSQMSSDVLKQWGSLNKTWASKLEGITQRLAEASMSHFPCLAKTEGGGTGRPSLYRIDWRQTHPSPSPSHLDPASTGAEIVTAARGDARYICEDIEDAGPLARIFTRGYHLRSWRRWLYIVVIVAPLLFCAFLALLMFLGWTMSATVDTKAALTLLMSMAIMVPAFWLTLGPLLLVAERRIVLAPWWMQSTDDDRLLELRCPPRHPAKCIKAVRYTGTCPICGGKMSAKSGQIQFWGRIVGRCEESPVEHVFSFDHVTRSGQLLRA